MIKTPLSTMIGGAFWTPNATILGGTSKTLNQLIKSLFANNEQGFAYDPNDLTTMYQDAAGTVAVTGAGQPVGLVLDKSKGLKLGDEAFNDANITFAGESSRVSTGVYRLYSSNGAYSLINKLNGLTVPTAGKAFLISFNVDSVTVAGSGISIEGSTQTITLPTSIGKKTVIVISNGSSVIGIKRGGTAMDVQISGISVKELPGNHAYQTTSASRPILRKNAVTGAYYLEFDGGDDFLVTSSIDFTSTDKISLFAGVRKFSDTTQSVVVELSQNWSTNNGSFSIQAPNLATEQKYAFTTRVSNSIIFDVVGYKAPNSAVISVRNDVIADRIYMKINGSLFSNLVDQGTGNYGNYPLYIGRRGGISLPFSGHLYSLIGIGRLTSDSETIALEKAIAKNTGVTLNV